MPTPNVIVVRPLMQENTGIVWSLPRDFLTSGGGGEVTHGSYTCREVSPPTLYQWNTQSKSGKHLVGVRSLDRVADSPDCWCEVLDIPTCLQGTL